MADKDLSLKLEESLVEESTVSQSNIDMNSVSEEDKENIGDKSVDGEHSEDFKGEDKENIGDKSADGEHSEDFKGEDEEASNGKRIRKKVDRLSTSTPVQQVKREISFSGSGSALKEIEYIEFKITKAKRDDLKALHNIMFRKQGTALTIRGNLRKFNGFNFSSEKGDLEKTKTKERITKLHKKELTNICDILGLEKSGNVPQVADRIFEFLISPADKGKKIPGKKSKKLNKNKKKTPKAVHKTTKKSSASEEIASASEEGTEDNDSEEEEEVEEKPSSPKKAPTATPKALKATPKALKATLKASKATPKASKATPKTPKGNKRARVMDDDDSSDDDIPLAKKMKPVPPTNTEIETFLKKYMKSVDLEEVSMRQIIQKVYDIHSDFDLTDRKVFIKSTVKDLIA